jgi:hypothetical protein
MKRATFMTVVMARVLATLAEAQSPQPPVPPQSNKAPAQVTKPAPTSPTLEVSEFAFPEEVQVRRSYLGGGFFVAAGFPFSRQLRSEVLSWIEKGIGRRSPICTRCFTAILKRNFAQV